MLNQIISVSLYFLLVHCSNLILSQPSGQILSQNARIQRLCSEMSATCARSCQSYIGHCNLSILPPPMADMFQTTALPQIAATAAPPISITVTADPPISLPLPTVSGSETPPQTIENMRCGAYRQNLLERLCSDMSNTCARNCQTYIEQCNLPSDSAASQSHDGISQMNPPVADAPQQQQQSTIVPIINRPPPPATTSASASQQKCQNHGANCIDHRDCCDFLYCKRFQHPTGAEAKLGYCEHDPAKI